MYDIEKTLTRNFYIQGKCTIRPDGIVDVDGKVNLQEPNKVSKLPVKFGTVTGDFYCSYNQLTTLQGVPHTVGGDFICYNNALTTLQGAPQSVGGDFICYNNALTTLQGAPHTVIGGFSCVNNQITSLEGAPQSIGSYFDCRYNQQLTSLNGAPQSVGGSFWIIYNKNLGLLKLIINNIDDLQIKDAPEIIEDIMNRYREKANSASTHEQRNALAVQCAAELIRAGYRNNARL